MANLSRASAATIKSLKNSRQATHMGAEQLDVTRLAKVMSLCAEGTRLYVQ